MSAEWAHRDGVQGLRCPCCDSFMALPPDFLAQLGYLEVGKALAKMVVRTEAAQRERDSSTPEG